MQQPLGFSLTSSEPLSLLNEPPRSSLIPITVTSSFIYKGVLGTSLYILCLMMLKALFVKLSMKYASKSLRTQSYTLTCLIHLSEYLLQLKALLPLHLRILLLAYVLCLSQQWLPCRYCKNWPHHSMNPPIHPVDHTIDVPPEPPAEHVLHVHLPLPLLTLLHIIANILHP